jgi:hypothetical protein
VLPHTHALGLDVPVELGLLGAEFLVGHAHLFGGRLQSARSASPTSSSTLS